MCHALSLSSHHYMLHKNNKNWKDWRKRVRRMKRCSVSLLSNLFLFYIYEEICFSSFFPLDIKENYYYITNSEWKTKYRISNEWQNFDQRQQRIQQKKSKVENCGFGPKLSESDQLLCKKQVKIHGCISCKCLSEIMFNGVMVKSFHFYWMHFLDASIKNTKLQTLKRQWPGN